MKSSSRLSFLLRIYTHRCTTCSPVQLPALFWSWLSVSLNFNLLLPCFSRLMQRMQSILAVFWRIVFLTHRSVCCIIHISSCSFRRIRWQTMEFCVRTSFSVAAHFRNNLLADPIRWSGSLLMSLLVAKSGYTTHTRSAQQFKFTMLLWQQLSFLFSEPFCVAMSICLLKSNSQELLLWWLPFHIRPS